MIRAVFFDLGGVVMRLDRAAMRRLEVDCGLPENGFYKALYGTPEWGEAQVGRISGSRWLEAASRQLQELVGGPAPSVLEVEFQMWHGVDDNIVALCRRLRGRYGVGVITNSTTRLRAEWLRPNRISDMFDLIINSATVRVAKPDRRIYLGAAERIGAEPSECVHIDDFEDNVCGAREAGFAAIHYRGHYPSLERELRALGVEW